MSSRSAADETVAPKKDLQRHVSIAEKAGVSYATEMYQFPDTGWVFAVLQFTVSCVWEPWCSSVPSVKHAEPGQSSVPPILARVEPRTLNSLHPGTI